MGNALHRGARGVASSVGASVAVAGSAATVGALERLILGVAVAGRTALTLRAAALAGVTVLLWSTEAQGPGPTILHADDQPPEAGAEDDRNPAQDKPLSKGEIKALWDKAGIDVHELKPGAGYDLYKTPTGEIVVKPKGGAGPGDPTGINIKDIMGGG